MKILIITDAWFPQINGVVRTYENLSKHMRKRGHTVKVIGPCDFPICTPMPGYSEIRLAIAPYKRLSRMIEEYAPDKIHLSTEGPLGWAGRKYCLKHGQPFSTSFHTMFPDYIAKRVAKTLPFAHGFAHERAKRFVRKFHSRSNAMMLATQSVEDTLKDWGFKNPMHRVTRGANLDQFSVGEGTLFKDLPRPVAIFVGRVAIEKNIEAFLEMEWDGSKVVVGDGPSLEALKRQYPDAVFLGSKLGEELANCYRSADVFVFPSKTDTFGIVLIEALASGIPVAAYNVTGPKDIITDNILGALDDDLSCAAKVALKAPGTKEERAKKVKEYYTWDNAALQYEEALIHKVVC